MINFNYTKPSSIETAIGSLSKDSSARFLAGGTNLVDLMKRGVETPQKLVDITGLPLRGIENSGAGLKIGALVSNRAAAEHADVLAEQPLLSLALRAGASPQLRNMATVGGNLLQRTRCHYFYDTALACNKREPGTGCSALKGYNRMHAIFGTSPNCIAVHPSDMAVALAALDTTVTVQGPKGIREIPFLDFHRLPGDQPQKDTNLERGELILGITVAPNRFGKHVHYLKVRDRSSYAFALVSVAAALELQGDTIIQARLALGGVAHKPWRLKEAEAYLKGKTVSEQVFATAASEAMAGAQGYGYNNFKLKMAPASIVEALVLAANA